MAEVTRANAEAEEARRERDEAIDALNAIRLEKKEWQRRVDGWKTSVSIRELGYRRVSSSTHNYLTG